MKKRNLKFTQFDKDHVLKLHKPRDASSDCYQAVGNQTRNNEEAASDDEEIQDSDADEKDLNNVEAEKQALNEDKNVKKQLPKKDNSSPPHKYYYEKFLYHDRNYTLDTRTTRKYFSSFKTVSRDQREYEQNKMKYLIPGVGKYYPKFKITEQITPAMTISKAELNRTRNLIQIQDYKDNSIQENSLPHLMNKNEKVNQYNSITTIDTNRSKSQINSIGDTKINITIKKQIPEVAGTAQELLIEDHEQSFNNSSQVNITPYKNINAKKKNNNSVHMTPTPLKMRDGWDHAHGMLDLNKQSQRKFVFENLIRVNDQRFNYIQFPKIYSKNKKVIGDLNFGKGSPRRDLFKPPDYQPMYTPSYDLVFQKDPKYVNMNIKPLKELMHNIV